MEVEYEIIMEVRKKAKNYWEWLFSEFILPSKCYRCFLLTDLDVIDIQKKIKDAVNQTFLEESK